MTQMWIVVILYQFACDHLPADSLEIIRPMAVQTILAIATDCATRREEKDKE